MNIVLLGCGNIAHRIAKGIQLSKGVLYGVASRNKEKAKEFALNYHIPHVYSYEECMADENVDLVYIATINPTHYDLTKQCLEHHKHVLCEKPFVSSSKEIDELFQIAKQNQCFLMEANKTCFTALNQVMMSRIKEIGMIKEIRASYCCKFKEENLYGWHTEEKMGGSFYDVGVYPICFSHLYAESEITDISIEKKRLKHFNCDAETKCTIRYKNGIKAYLKSSWINKEINRGIIIGEKGKVEIIDFWKSTEAILTKIEPEIIRGHQESDFTNEINHAISCINNGLLISPIMSDQASKQISFVLEYMKKTPYMKS